MQVQVEGRSLVGLLKNQRAEFADRYLVTHCGRWRRGHAAKAKFAQCSIRNGRFTLVNNAELYDLQKDPGETTNVLTGHPEVVAACGPRMTAGGTTSFPGSKMKMRSARM